MDKDSSHRSQMEQSYGYKIVEVIDPIVAAIQDITSNSVEQIALVTITLRFDNARSGSDHGPVKTNASASKQLREGSAEEIAPFADLLSGEQVTRYLLDNLRPLVRKTDRVFLREHTLYFLLPGANLQGGQIVQNRLWEALLWHVNNITHAEATEQGSLVSTSAITIGLSAYPVPCIDINEFIRAAGDVILCFDQQPKRSEGSQRRRGRSDIEVGEKHHKGLRPGQQTNLLEL